MNQTASVGHNSRSPKPVDREELRVGGAAADRLRSIVDRIERLEGEKADIATDIKEVYQEAKSSGFDNKVLRELIKIRKREAAEQEEFETILDVYRNALGM